MDKTPITLSGSHLLPGHNTSRGVLVVMLIALPILILFITPLFMLAINLRRPKFPYFWLLAASASLLVWPIILIALVSLPVEIQILHWQPEEFFLISPALLLDRTSWPFALALVTLNLAVVLTAVARDRNPTEGLSPWGNLATPLLITAVSLMAVISENVLTLILTWTVLDLLEMFLWLVKIRNNDLSQRIIIAISTRLGGVVLLIWTAISAYAARLPLSLVAIPPELGTYLLIAAGLRLGVFPLTLTLPEALPERRGVKVISLLAPQAANLTLLVRTASVGASSASSPYLFVLTGFAALYAGLSWIGSTDELEGSSFWALGISCLALAAAIQAKPAASLAWGVALLLPGGLLLLYSSRQRWLLPLLLFATLSISSLPFTPTWQGVRLYEAPFHWLGLPLITAQSLMIAGYLRYALRPANPLVGAERWVRIIYPWGLVLLPSVHWSIAWWSRPESFPSWLSSWPAVLSTGMVFLILWLGRRGEQAPAMFLKGLRTALTFGWAYKILESILRPIRSLLAIANTVLEGNAGILWALLIVILLLSISIQPGG